MDRPTSAPVSPSPSPTLPSVVAVIGLGTMGTGIAEVLIRAGHEVIGVDVSDAAARTAVASLETATARAVERGRLTEGERTDALARFRTFPELRAAAEADLVIEVVDERYDIKREVFTALDRLLKPEAIIATGTNALSVTRLAAETGRPDRVLGLHFFTPAQAMKLVEVVSTVLTSPETTRAVTALVRTLGKEPVPVGDRPGFIADGLLFGYLNQAAAMYEARYATREDIDAAMRLGCGLPMGPLALLDLIGDRHGHHRAGGDVPGQQGPAARARAGAAAADRRRAAGPQVRPRLLQLRGAGQRGRRAGRADPGRRGAAARRAAVVRSVGRRGVRHDGHRDRGGVRQGRVRRGAGRRARRRRPSGRWRGWRSRWTARWTRAG